MTRSRTRLASLALVVVMVLSVGATGTAVAGTSGNDATGDEPADQTFVVQQAGECYAATTLGNGSQTVESFYNYSADYDWSSEGTKHLQENQVSNLFVYEGSEGYSLVFVHDEHGDGPYGSTITFTVDGQPADGEWAVEDDDYQGRDDNFDHHGTYSEIDWKWAPDRNDGAAFRGLTAENDVAITVDPAFNEEAEAWGSWPYSGDEDNRTESWQLLGADGEPITTLDMTENVTVTTGTCGDGLSAALSVNDSSVTTDQPVEFDASGSTSGAAIVEYHWDFDGDGETDETTDSATTTHAYASDGEFDATVTAVDESGDEDSASATVTVSADEQTDGEPTAKLDAPSEATIDTTVTLDASASTDDEGIVKYHWDLDGDGEVDEKTTSATYEKTVTAAGEFEPTVTVKDADGNADTASTHITVTDGENDTEPPTADLKIPDEVTVGETFTAEATNVSDPSGVAHVCWYHDGEAGPEGTTMTHSFDEAGEHTVSVMLRDEAGNEQKLTHTIEVVAADSGDDGDDSKDSDDSNSDDSDESDNDDSNSTPISNDHDTDDDEPDISVTSVNVSADEVEVGENVSFTVTLTNDGDADGTHTVSLSATGPVENVTGENATVDVDADETRNVTLSTSFAEAGEYNVSVDDESVALTVTEAETETATEESDEIDSDESDGTDAETESETDADDEAGGAQEPDGDDSATGASGPGFGVLSVLVAALVGVGMLVRRL